MTYKGYQINRGEVVQVSKHRRRGTLDVVDPEGNSVHIVSYTVGNSFSRTFAKSAAKAWIDKRLRPPESKRRGPNYRIDDIFL